MPRSLTDLIPARLSARQRCGVDPIWWTPTLGETGVEKVHMSNMEAKRTRRVHTREFKAETVELVRAGGRSIGQLARDLGLADSMVRAW
jgi:hypothetical protein